MHYGVKASSKSKNDICRSDTYLAISDVCNLCREMSFILVIIGSSFSSMCVAEPEDEDTWCSRSPVPGVASSPCFCSEGPNTPGVYMVSCKIG